MKLDLLSALVRVSSTLQAAHAAALAEHNVELANRLRRQVDEIMREVGAAAKAQRGSEAA